MAVVLNKVELPTKFERVYEDEESISIWKYDLKKNPNGPISTEIKYKKGFEPQKTKRRKFIKDLIEDQDSQTQ